MNRRLSSLALFWCFLLLGIFVSALGPAVPSMSRDVGVNEVAFGRAFSLRGLGSLLGSYGSSVTWKSGENQTELQRLLNNRMYRLGAATAGMGLFAVALTTAPTLAWVCTWCFLQGVCVGAVDAIGNAAISAVHGAGVAPWMQGLHSCFSTGALVAPVLVGQLGYSAVLLFLGLLALPAGLMCCVAGGAGGGGNCGENLRRSKPSYMEGKQQQGTCEDVVFEGVELVRGARTPETRKNVGLEGGEGDEGQVCGRSANSAGEALLQERDEESWMSAPSGKSPTVSKNIPHRLATVAENRPRNGNAGVATSTSSIKSPRCDGEITNQTGAETRAAMLTEADEYWRSEEIEKKRMTNVGSAGVPSGERGRAEEGRPSPFILVGMLTLFLFLYVGVEVGFGAWVAVVVLRDRLAGEAVAASIASLFWGGITVGRLLAVPLAVRFSTDSLVRANLLGCLLSSTLLVAVGRESLGWAATGAGLFGVCMASIFPLAMSLLPSWGYVLSDKNSSRMVIGGALGEMIVPASIAGLLGPNDGGRPSALYVACGAVSLFMIVVYGVWCRLAWGRPLKM